MQRTRPWRRSTPCCATCTQRGRSWRPRSGGPTTRRWPVPRHSSTSCTRRCGMSDPALTLAPVLADLGTGTRASTRTLHDELLERAARDDYDEWLTGTLAAGGCTRPIRLRGTACDIDPATGEV